MSEFDILQIGSLIRKARKERGLRLEDIADENISPATVSNIERGVPHVSTDKVIYLLEKLGLTMDDIPQILESAQEELDDLKLQLTSIESLLGHENPTELLFILDSLKVNDDHKLSSYVYFLRGKCFIEQSNWNKAERAFLNAIRLSASNPFGKESNIEARSFVELGRCYYFRNDLIQALQYTESAADAFVEDGDHQQLKYIINLNKARYLEKLGRLGEAMKVVNLLWNDIDQMSDTLALHLYEIRINVLKRTKMYEDAIKYAKEGINLARLNGDNLSLFYLWTALGGTYLTMKNLKKSEVCLKTALKLGDPKYKNVLIEVYSKLSIVYMEQGLWEEAQKLLSKAEKMTEETDVISSFFTYLVIGDFHKKQNQTKKAVYYYQKSLNLAKKYSLKKLEYKALFRLAQLKRNESKEEFASYLENMYEVAVSLEKIGDGGDYSEIL